ncbi:MAG: hypothetical protein ACREBU_10905 [Nitrososphaera sp.]
MAVEVKSERELELERKENEAEVQNKQRTGIGTRVRVGQTRGKSPLVITWEAFDDSKPETLPTSIQEFTSVTKTADEATLLNYLIVGYNDAAYTAASDPLAEFVNPTWPDEAQVQFRLVVRNYSRGANVSLEDAVTLIKPGFEKQFSLPKA